MKNTHAGRLRDDHCDADWIYERDIETASPAEIRELANANWKRQAEELVDRSPFYRRKFAASGVDITKVRTVDDLKLAPFTTKSELKEEQEAHPPFGDHLGVPLDRVKRVYQTSGTTGNPSLLALTSGDLDDVWGRIALRSYYGSGYHPHNSIVTNFGAGPFVAGTTHRVLERLGARTIPVAPQDTERIIRSLQLGIADSLLGTPSFMIYLAARFEKDGLDARRFGVVHINVGGEPGAGIPAIRQRIEEAFATQLTEIMGLGDISPSLFSECPVGGGMHFSGQGLVWMELVDPTGNRIEMEPGASGEPVYTHLAREAMPLVRFRSGDTVVIQESNCECERTSFRIRCVGRVDDMFIVRGVNVYPSAVQSVVADFRPKVTGRCRVVLQDQGVSVEPPVPIEVEVSDDINAEPDLASQIEDRIRAKLTFRAQVKFVAESAFGDAGYKTRSVVRVPVGP